MYEKYLEQLEEAGKIRNLKERSIKMGNSDWNCPLIVLIMRFFLACTDFCIK